MKFADFSGRGRLKKKVVDFRKRGRGGMGKVEVSAISF